MIRFFFYDGSRAAGEDPPSACSAEARARAEALLGSDWFQVWDLETGELTSQVQGYKRVRAVAGLESCDGGGRVVTKAGVLREIYRDGGRAAA